MGIITITRVHRGSILFAKTIGYLIRILKSRFGIHRAPKGLDPSLKLFTKKVMPLCLFLILQTAAASCKFQDGANKSENMAFPMWPSSQLEQKVTSTLKLRERRPSCSVYPILRHQPWKILGWSKHSMKPFKRQSNTNIS